MLPCIWNSDVHARWQKDWESESAAQYYTVHGRLVEPARTMYVESCRRNNWDMPGH